MMADLLHTADVHLAEGHPERLEALEAVIDAAEARDAPVVTVGGDLFHEPHDVDAIRPALRGDSLADRDVEVVIIPGNHDREGFRGNTYFGDSATVLLEEPFEHHHPAGADCRITGVPFVDRPDESLFVELADRPPHDGPEVLLLHCSLDVGLPADATGEEAERVYFPVTPPQLAELEFDYVLAGHFHQPHHERLDVGEFAYPGTPAATSWSETGPRSAVAVDFEGAGLEFVPLATHHRVVLERTVLPGREPALFEEITEWVDRTVDDQTVARVDVDGFHRLDEAEFDRRLASAADDAEVTNESRVVEAIERHPLYRAFDERVADADWDEATADAVREAALTAFNRARGEL